MYRKQFLDKTVKMLAERDNSGKTGYYFPVHVSSNLKRGRFYNVIIKDVLGDRTEAAIDR